MNKYFDEIYNYVKDLTIIDTHEHLPGREVNRDKDTDILKEYLIHYFKCDLISAGMPLREMEYVRDNCLPLMERWKMVEPYWEAARNTGYARALDFTVQGLYGINGINGNTLEALNFEFKKTLEGGHYDTVLREKSKIAISLLDTDLDCDSRYFVSVYKIDYAISPGNTGDIMQVEKVSGVNINSFDDYLNAIEVIIDYAISLGVPAFKCGLAYKRTLRFDKADKNEAETEFNNSINNRRKANANRIVDIKTSLEFQNYLMHHVMCLVNKRKLTYQFHTGLQEGNGNIIGNSDPSLLSNLFLIYPDVKFDIFHMGYPYYHNVAALAKNFQNVFIDMCWGHIISPTASIDALAEWLDAVPANKISAFGGDYCFIDGVYGHQYLARLNVSKTLARKIEEGVFSVDRAKTVAKMLFYDNPVRIFDLESKLQPAQG